MSFLRHGEIYRSDGNWGKTGSGSSRRPQPVIGLDEFPAGYSWRVALQQSPRPLSQPQPYSQSSTSLYNAFAANGKMSLNCLSQPRGPVQGASCRAMQNMTMLTKILQEN
jgi:hypothetical protein